MTRVLDGAIEKHACRCDNGPELTNRHFLAWAIENKINFLHIQPGKSTENVFVESFHGRLRDECLNVSWFWNLFDARRKIAAWQLDYNTERPHSSLAYRTPHAFAEQCRLNSKEQNPSEGKITAKSRYDLRHPSGPKMGSRHGYVRHEFRVRNQCLAGPRGRGHLPPARGCCGRYLDIRPDVSAVSAHFNDTATFVGAM
jgi:hypothetical protein